MEGGDWRQGGGGGGWGPVNDCMSCWRTVGWCWGGGGGGEWGAWRYDQSGRAAGGQSWINLYKD